MGEHVRAGDLDIWTEQVGAGPDAVDRRRGGHRRVVAVPARRLADRYRLIAFDNRGRSHGDAR